MRAFGSSDPGGVTHVSHMSQCVTRVHITQDTSIRRSLEEQYCFVDFSVGHAVILMSFISGSWIELVS